MPIQKPTPISKASTPVAPAASAFSATVVEMLATDACVVQAPGFGPLRCSVLQMSAFPPPYQLGDTVLVLRLDEGLLYAVVGRIRAGANEPSRQGVIALVAEQALSLQCGHSSIDLRADGKVLIRGDDVLVRAKGTKRIRAGTVSIN